MSAQALSAIGKKCRQNEILVTMLDGNVTTCNGEVDLRINVNGVAIELCCLVSNTLVSGCSLILGMDGIMKLGGVCINHKGHASFEKMSPLAAVCTKADHLTCKVYDKDFTARFDVKSGWWSGNGRM